MDYAFSTNKVFINGTHDSYPSYEITLLGTKMYDYKETRLRGLLGDGDVTFTDLEVKR